MVKIFRRQRLLVVKRGQLKFFRVNVEVNDATAAAPLGPLLGQVQVPLLEFCNSFNTLSVDNYNESFDLRVCLTKIESKYNYVIKYPSVAFFIYQFYLMYGLEFEEMIYLYYEVAVVDFWYLLQLYAVILDLSMIQIANIFFGYFYTSIIRRIF